MKYADKLKDPRWQKRRLEIFERDGWRCRSCDSDSDTLCVHHVYYVKGVEPWGYDKSLLVTLCDPCHTKERQERSYYESQLLSALKESAFDISALRSLSEIFSELHPEWGQDHVINALYNIIKQLPEVPFASGIKVIWNNG